MIWLRRGLTAPLGLLLLVSLALALVVLQANDTLLSPSYYKKELRKANVYEFALVDVTTALLDEARRLSLEDLPDSMERNLLVTLDLSTAEIVSSINRALPPEWVQAQVEEALEDLGSYITGERDTFEIRIQAGEQVPTAVSEVKALLRKANAYNLLFDELVTPEVRDAMAGELPLGLEIESARVVESVRRVVAPEWVRAQVESALDVVTPYVVGESDTFEINVHLADRVDIALEEIKGLLRETNAYDLLYNEVIEPEITGVLGLVIQLPFGLTVTNGEVVSALRQAAPPEWVQEQAERVISEAGPYLTGESSSLAVDVSLADNKRQARAVIEEIVEEKLRAALDVLTVCTEDSLQPGPVPGSTTLPDCIPADLGSDEIIQALSAEVTELIDSLIIGLIPNNVRFTDANLRQALILAGAQDNVDLLDDIRDVVADGWTYSYVDLRADVRGLFDDPIDGDRAVDALDDIRGFLRGDSLYDEQKLRADILDGDDDVRDFDRLRTNADRARTFKLIVYLPALVLLLAIGLLGGRRWSHRIAWASAFLAVAAGVTYALTGPVYDSVGSPRVDDAWDEILEEIDFDDDFGNTERLVVQKALEIADSVADGFASGIASKSMVLLIIGLLALGVSARWDSIARLAGRAEPP